LREIALKKRLAAKLAQEKEEKEKAAMTEEVKKKEQELVRLLSPPSSLSWSSLALITPFALLAPCQGLTDHQKRYSSERGIVERATQERQGASQEEVP
jgi:hypothetical protein